MRTLAFDGPTGASGDMLLGALLAAGADRAVLESVEDALGVRYDVSSTTSAGIQATAVTVRTVGHERDDGDSSKPLDRAEHGHETRSYPDVSRIVADLGLDPAVEREALAIVERLGTAEASVHGTELAETHFHEVGADDAIADIVGSVLLMDDLGVDRVVTTPVAAGGGDVETSHGTYPVPAPAVVEIAAGADWDLRGGRHDTELLTPTGAAILAHVADGVDRLPHLRVEQVGYGAGSKSLGGDPNVLRAIVGAGGGGLDREEITVLETNLDDASPEVLGSLQETLTDAGALDVSVVPLTMKKSRPGHLVKVVCHPADAGRVAQRLAEETGTLGVREHGAGHRWVADRRVETVSIVVDGETWEIDLKVASDTAGTVFDVSAEFDDARAIARTTGLSVRQIMCRAETRWRDGEDDATE